MYLTLLLYTVTEDNKISASVQESCRKTIHVVMMKEENIVRRMLDEDIPGKIRRDRTHMKWKDACKRDMTEVGLKENNTRHKASWRNTMNRYTRDPRMMTVQTRDEDIFSALLNNCTLIDSCVVPRRYLWLGDFISVRTATT